MPNPVPYLLVGLFFGSLFLTLGILLGIWICRAFGLGNANSNASRNGGALDRQEPLIEPLPSSGPDEARLNSPSSEEMIKIRLALDQFAKWTTDFSSDFSRYRREIDQLNAKASNHTVECTREDIQRILDQIVDANTQLKERLTSAEEKLETQTSMLANFLSEARTDSLTGLLNRRAFDQRIEHCFNRWCDTHEVFSLILIDIDHFKSVNDTFGHPVGDQVLREIAKQIAFYSNEQTHVSRFGGEEFAILVDAELLDAAELAESLRRKTEQLQIEAEDKTLLVTLSVGVSQIQPDDKIGKLVRRADEALYSAKIAGRNRVFIHTGSTCQVFGLPTSNAIHRNAPTLPILTTKSDRHPATFLNPFTGTLEQESRNTDQVEEKHLGLQETTSVRISEQPSPQSVDSTLTRSDQLMSPDQSPRQDKNVLDDMYSDVDSMERYLRQRIDSIIESNR